MFPFWLYLTLKSLHIIAFTAWMAGLFYLPRLFVYHTRLDPQADEKSYQMFLLMERKLLTIIMRPAMIATWIFGLLLALHLGYLGLEMPLWLLLKLLAILGLTYFQHHLVGHHRAFEAEANETSEGRFRLINEAPTLALALAVVLVIFQPTLG